MNKILKNKIIIFSVVAISLLAYFVISTNFAEAQNPGSTVINIAGPAVSAAAGAVTTGASAIQTAGKSALNGATWGVILFGILYVLNLALWKFISLGYSLLNTAVNTALDPNWFQVPAVLDAWRLIRDFANIWFILILLFIAIGTILRAQSYQAKKLLPTLIMVALVINFSLPITGFIIDISNVISFQFLKAICPEIKQQTGSTVCDFSANVENAFQLRGFSQAINQAIEKPPTSPPPSNNPSVNLVPEAHAAIPAVLAIAGKWLGAALLTSGIQIAAGAITTTTIGAVSGTHLVDLIMDDVFLIFALFVILSMALLFLIRIVSLIFLVILSPLGFTAAILPATQKFSSDWWDYLFKQAFFAPFALFFLWASLHLMNTMQDAFLVGGETYELTNPSNARLLFFIFSAILLYASLWISKKMGAIGATMVMGWGKWLKGAITGFAGGLAARTLVAPIGASMAAAGLPQAIGRISPLAGIKTKEFADWLSKRGKAPEQAAAKAELGMQLAPAERAAYFAKLDRSAKEAMLRKMKGEERESLIAQLPSDSEKQIARSILGSFVFTGEEQIKSQVEKFKFEKNLIQQWQQFGNLSTDEQKQFLLGIEDADKRAQFLEHVREEAEKGNSDIGRTAFKNANTFLEEGVGFSANQRYANKLAREKVEHTEAQKRNELAEFFNKITKDANGNELVGEELETALKEQKRRFKFATNDSQKLALVEAAKTDSDKLKRLAGWMLEQDPADQDKFYKSSIGGKDTSLAAVVAYIKAISTSDPNRDLAIKKMILSGATPQQLGSVARELSDDSELVAIADELSTRMSTRNQNEYNREKAKPRGGPGGPTGGTPTGGGGAGPTGGEPSAGGGGTPITPVAPTVFSKIETQQDAFDSAINFKLLVNNNNAEETEKAVKIIKSLTKEQQIEITRYSDPIQKIQYFEKILPTQKEEFETALTEDIKHTERGDFANQIYLHPGIIRDPAYQRAFLRGSDAPKIVSLIREYPNGIGFLVNELTQNMPTNDPETHAQAVAEKFEKEFKNRELGIIFADLIRTQKEKQSPVAKEVYEALFGPQL